MNDGLFTLSWAAFFGTSAAMWAMTTAMSAYITEMQKEVVLSRFSDYIKSGPLSAVSTISITPQQIIEDMRARGVALTTLPDLTMEIKMIRYLGLAWLSAAFILNAAAYGSHSLGNNNGDWVSIGLVIASTGVCILYFLYSFVRPIMLGYIFMLSELSQWQQLVKKTKEALRAETPLSNK